MRSKPKVRCLTSHLAPCLPIRCVQRRPSRKASVLTISRARPGRQCPPPAMQVANWRNLRCESLAIVAFAAPCDQHPIIGSALLAEQRASVRLGTQAPHDSQANAAAFRSLPGMTSRVESPHALLGEAFGARLRSAHLSPSGRICDPISRDRATHSAVHAGSWAGPEIVLTSAGGLSRLAAHGHAHPAKRAIGRPCSKSAADELSGAVPRTHSIQKARSVAWGAAAT